MCICADKPHGPSAMIRAGKTYQIISAPLGCIRLLIDTKTGRWTAKDPIFLMGEIPIKNTRIGEEWRP